MDLALVGKESGAVMGGGISFFQRGMRRCSGEEGSRVVAVSSTQSLATFGSLLAASLRKSSGINTCASVKSTFANN
jgi:hypothetical protein